jgi:hypothetical protein
MLHEHKGHAAIRWHVREELLEGRQATCRRAHADNDTVRWRLVRAHRLALFRRLWVL